MDFRRAVGAMIPDAQGRILASLAARTRRRSSARSRLAGALGGGRLAHVGTGDPSPRGRRCGRATGRQPPAVLVRLDRGAPWRRRQSRVLSDRHCTPSPRGAAGKNSDSASNRRGAVGLTLFGSCSRLCDERCGERPPDVVVVRPSLDRIEDVIRRGRGRCLRTGQCARTPASLGYTAESHSRSAGGRSKRGSPDPAVPLWEDEDGAKDTAPLPARHDAWLMMGPRRHVPPRAATHRPGTQAQARSDLAKADEVPGRGARAQPRRRAAATRGGEPRPAATPGRSVGDVDPRCTRRSTPRPAQTMREPPPCSSTRGARARTQHVVRKPSPCRCEESGGAGAGTTSRRTTA